MKLVTAFIGIIFLLSPSLTYACRETSNSVVFAHDTGSDNYCYAISLPPEAMSNETGKTDIHTVVKGHDKVEYSFNFYSRNIFLTCDRTGSGKKGISFVREIYSRHLVLTEKDYDVLEFYFDGKMVKKYSARDLTNNGKETYWPATSCGDRIIWNMRVNYSPEKNASFFRVQFADKLVDYDLMTGEIAVQYDKPDELWEKMQAFERKQKQSSAPAQSQRPQTKGEDLFSVFEEPKQ